MYTIVMQNTKELVKTVETNLYQRENLVDKIQFLIPEQYEDIKLADFTATLKYADPNLVAHAEILQLDEELYKGYLRYVLPIDTSLTEYAGDIEIRITFSKTDLEAKKQYVLHTGTTVVSIQTVKDYYTFVPDESLEFVDQKIGELDAKISALEAIATTYDQKKADNITYDENKIQLTANGEKIGNAITIITDEEGNPGIIDTEFEVVEF